MACCGQARRELASTQKKFIKIAYLGKETVFSIKGPMTGKTYRWRGTNDAILMDKRDWKTIDVKELMKQ